MHVATRCSRLCVCACACACACARARARAREREGERVCVRVTCACVRVRACACVCVCLCTVILLRYVPRRPNVRCCISGGGGAKTILRPPCPMFPCIQMLLCVCQCAHIFTPVSPLLLIYPPPDVTDRAALPQIRVETLIGSQVFNRNNCV